MRKICYLPGAGRHAERSGIQAWLAVRTFRFAIWMGSRRLLALKGPITVVTFIATECPVSNSYNQRMSDLYKDYTPKT